MSAKNGLIPLEKTIPLYIILAVFVGWMMSRCFQAFLPVAPIWVFWAAYILCSFSLPIAFIFPKLVFSQLLDAFGNYWLCFQSIAGFAAAVDLLLMLLLVGVLKLQSETYANFSLVLYILAGVFTLYGIVHARRIYLTRYICVVEKACDKLNIIHLSDLHLSSINNLHQIKSVVQRVNALNPDLVCITGDTFTENLRSIPDIDGIAAALKGLHSKYGTFGCLGNHDYGPEFYKMHLFFESTNIHILRDESIDLGGITVIGRHDLAPNGTPRKRKSIWQLMQDVNRDNIIIVLDHQPAEFHEESQAGADLVLSGHTHGGQFFPIHRVIHKLFPHYSGCKKYGETYAIVSSGTCTAVPPIRVGSKSEIISIVLNAAP